MKTLRFTTLLLVTSLALAITYRVDPEGGPDTLAAEVSAAFDAWLELDDSLELETDDEARTVFAYGENSLFGPDILSLTVQRQEPSGVAVLLHPSASRANTLLHETGLILGVAVADEGAMNPALGDAALSLGEIEAEGLRQQLGAVAEDLNFDGEVNFYDLVELGKSFGQSGFSLPADIDESGVVDEADIELLREAYTFSAPSETAPGEDDLLTDEPTLDDSSETGESEEGEPTESEPIEGEESEDGESEDGEDGSDAEGEPEGTSETEEEPATEPTEDETETPADEGEADEGESDSEDKENTDGEGANDNTEEGDPPPPDDTPEDDTEDNTEEGDADST